MFFRFLSVIFIVALPLTSLYSSQPEPIKAPKGDAIADRDMDGELGEAELIYARAEWYAATHGGTPMLDAGTRLSKAAWSVAHPPVKRSDGPDWRSLGPINGAGRATAVTPHPLIDGTFLIGAAGGGVWRTTDMGESWEVLTDMLPDLSVGALTYAPSNPDTVYLGSGEGGYAIDFIPGIGLIKSYDGGMSWILPDDVIAEMFYDISVDPRNENILAAGTNRGLLYSTNGGVTWSTPIQDVDITDVVRSSSNPDLLFASAWCAYSCDEETFTRIWKSLDGGVSWSPSDNGIEELDSSNSFYERTSLAIAPSNDKILYAAFSGTDGSGNLISRVYRTSNGGDVWTEMEDVANNSSTYGYYIRNFLGRQGWYDNAITVSPSDPDIVNAGGVFYIRSVDGGLSWFTASFSAYPHVDAHDYAYQGNTLILACDGGIYTSNDEGYTWLDRNSGLVTRQYYGMDHDPTHRARIIGGTQDNGTDRRRDNDSGFWDHVIGGDGFECAINPEIPDIAYGTVQFGMIFRSNNFGGSSTFSEITPAYLPGDSASFLSIFTIHPALPSTIFTGSKYVWRSRDGGETWLQLPIGEVTGEGWNGSQISAVSVTAVEPDALLVSKGAELFWSRDGGFSWVAFSPEDGTLPVYGSIRNAELSPHDPMNAAIAFSWSDGGSIYLTQNGGATWERRDSGLPPYSAQVVRFDPVDPSTLYAGTDLGFYRSIDLGLTWEEYGTGLPRSSIHDIRILKDGSALRVATHGRGIWEAVLPEPVNQPPVVDIVEPSGTRYIPQGETVTFTGTVSDPDGDPLAASWVFPDTWKRTPFSSTPVTHTFTRPGAFPVSLTAADPGGSMRSATVRIEVAPEGDTCSSPIIIPTGVPLPFTVVTNNETANFEIETPAAPCVPSNAGYFGSLWFVFTPEESATYTIDTCGSGGDTVLSVWYGTACGPWTLVEDGCNDDDESVHCQGSRTNSYVSVDLEAGVTYYAFVGSYYDDQRGSIHFTVDCLNCSSTGRGVTMTVPASASAPGSHGTSWVTDLVVLNATENESSALLTYRDRNVSGLYEQGKILTIPARGSLSVEDIVQDLFGRTGSAGSIDLTLPEGSAVTTRTYNDAEKGTYGQTIPAFESRSAFTVLDRVYLPFVTVTNTFRTNLGVVNLHDQPIIVHAEIYNDSGTSMATRLLEIPAKSSVQEGIQIDSMPDGYIILTTPSFEAEYFPYLSIVDNVSGDPVYVYPLEPSGETLYIPASAHAPGARDTTWRTDLEVINPTSASVLFNLYFLPQGGDNTSRTGPSFTLEGKASIRFVDVVGSTLKKEGAGALQIVTQGGQLIAVTRTYTEEEDGTYGQYIPAVTGGESLGEGETAYLAGLKRTDDFRTNLGFLNGTSTNAVISWVIFSEDGEVLLSDEKELLPYEYYPVNDLLLSVGADVPLAWAEITTETPGAEIYTYASVVDNGSGDPVYIYGAVKEVE